MNGETVESLQSIALVQVTSNFWVQVLHANSKTLDYTNSACFALLARFCKDKALKFELKTFVTDIKSLVWPIGLEIRRFLRFQETFSTDKDFLLLSLRNMRFSTKRTVEIKETIKLLIRNENISINMRYKLACSCCLENDILNFWYQISDQQRAAYLSDPLEIDDCRMNIVAFWSLFNDGRQSLILLTANRHRCNSIYEYAFQCSFYMGNKEAVRHFWYKVEASRMLQITARVLLAIGNIYNQTGENFFRCQDDPFHTENRYYREIILFIFVNAGEEFRHTHLNTLISYGIYRLICAESSHPKNNELSLLSYMKDGQSEIFQDVILEVFIRKRRSLYKNSMEIICNLCKEMFQQIHTVYREATQSDYVYFLNFFLQFRDTEMIEFILNDCNPRNLRKLMINRKNMDICKELASDQEWNLLTKLIKKCLSKHNLKSFRDYFKNSKLWRYHNENVDDLESQEQMVSFLDQLKEEM